MKVAFSHDVFGLQSRGGISRYVTELHRAFVGLGVESTILAGLHVSDTLSGLPGVIGWRLPGGLPYRARRAASSIGGEVAEHYARLQREDVYHLTYYPRTPLHRGKVLAVTVYDMIHERFPHDFPASDTTSERKRRACDASDLIFAISESTRGDLLASFDVPEHKVIVTPLGVSRLGSNPARLSPARRPYLLYVGARQPSYKNFLPLVRALRQAGLLSDFDLVSFGGGPLTTDETTALAALGVRGVVRVVSGDDHLLASHYRHARAYVCPSLYEGFGLPALEAMSVGCPVACSGTSSLPEVCGTAAAYFDPCDEDHMGTVIREVVEDPTLRRDLIAGAATRANGFSWTRTARTTLNAYQRAIELAE